MTSPSAGHRGLRLAASGGVLLALAGVWMSHTLEYARVLGLDGIRDVMLGSLHLYMLPVGMLLALAAAAGAVRGVRLWLGLGRQLHGLRSAVAMALRGRRAPGAAAPAGSAARSSTTPRPPRRALTRVAAWWLPLTALQLGLYLFQENVEAAISGAPSPGLGAVLGTHAPALLIHAAVALALCAAAVLAGRLLRRRADVVARVAALLRHLLDRLGSLRPETQAARPLALTPLDRFGRLWCRPPPLPAV
jgi:hypothetical protein